MYGSEYLFVVVRVYMGVLSDRQNFSYISFFADFCRARLKPNTVVYEVFSSSRKLQHGFRLHSGNFP